VSAGSPDLFVVCKNCHAEVSPYITECPYCGNRLRKRAPKIDRNGQVNEKRRRTPGPSLSRLKPNEIPGIRGDSHPYASIALLVAGFAGTLLYRAALIGSTHAMLLWAENDTHMWWRLLIAPLTYVNTGYAVVVLGTIGVFGWLIERRHGPIVILVLYAIGAVGGTAAAIALNSHAYVLGANGAALAFIAAWAVPDLLDLRAGQEVEGDLIGAGVIAAAVALMPLIGADASWIADVVGVLAGLLVGLGLTRVSSS
jgi:membrane associated rhomboid family serine protease